MPISQSITGRNGLSKTIALVQKWKNAIFLESFSSFSNEVDKEQIKNFYWLIINSFSLTSRW